MSSLAPRERLFGVQPIVACFGTNERQHAQNRSKLVGRQVPSKMSSSIEKLGTILLSIPGSPAMLTAIELQLATEIIEILSPLEKMTKEVCGERYVIASKIIPLLNCFKHKMQSIRDNLKTPVALSLLDRLQQSITSRFGQIEHNSIMAVSTILDPRYKKMHFNQNLACSNTINRIAKWMRQIDETNISGAVSRTDFRIQTNLDDNDDNLWSFS